MQLFKITSLISKTQWTSAERDQIVSFLISCESSVRDQKYFFDYCKQWKLAPWVCSQLKKHNLFDRLSENTREQFSQIHSQVKKENEARNTEALRFLKAFKENGIEVIVLKGNLLAHTIYFDAGYKRMNDFDILVHEHDWERIQDIYYSLGYIPLGFGWAGEKQKPARFSHVGMSFISPDFSCIIGTQWGLKSPTAGYEVNIKEAWQTAKDFDFMGVNVKQLSLNYNLLHLVLHLGIYKCGIRDTMDIFNLANANGIAEAELTALFKKTRAQEKAWFAFSLAALSSPELSTYAQQLKPATRGFVSRRLKKRLERFGNAGDLHDSYNDYFQDIEKEVIYFNIFPEFHKKLFFYYRILKKILLPKMNMALRLSDQPDNSGSLAQAKARIKAPYFVFSLIAQEIGWTFTLLLFIKLFFDLLFSLKNYLIKKESYFDYLQHRGIDPKAIEKAMKNIQ